MNETGLNFGMHAIVGASYHWKGMPNDILYRKITEDAGVDFRNKLIKIF